MTTQSGFIPPLSQNVPIVDRNGNPTFEFMLKFNKQNALNAGIPSTSALMSAALDLIGDTKGDLLVRDTLLWTPFHAGADGSILRTHGAGTLPSWDTISTILDTVSNTQGSVLYRGSAGWVALGPGPSGFFLKTLGTAANPAWAAVPVGVTAANPTATASDTAVNGSAATFMRSDAAPAVQIGDATHFGIYKVDNVTITATLGVLSAAGGGLSAIADNSLLANISGGSAVPVAHTLSDFMAYGLGYTYGSTSAVIQLARSDISANFRAEVYSSSSVTGPVFFLGSAGGSQASATAPVANAVLGTVRFGGLTTAPTTMNGTGEIRTVVKETTYSAAHRGAFMDLGVAKLGTNTTVRVLTIDADNGLTTNGVNWLTAAGVLKASALDTPYPAGANPSATASDTAVNGTSGSFMRADASPAIQKGSATGFGVVKADGTSITSSAGVLTATGFVPLAAAFHPGYVTGRIYLPSMIAAAASLALATNLVYACPIYVGVSHTFTGIAFHVQSAGVAGTLADVGLYSNVNGQPGSLLFDAGTVSVATTGDKTVSVSMALAPGWYWAVIGVSAACNVFSAGTGPYNYQLGVSSFDGTILTRLRGPWTFSAGALPGSFPTITYDAGTAMPLMGLVA